MARTTKRLTNTEVERAKPKAEEYNLADGQGLYLRVNPKEQACNILADKGILKKGSEQGYKFMTKLPHKVDPKRTRCYLLMPITELEADGEVLEQTE